MNYSIIIPTYNHLTDCLKPCIESIIKYTNLNDDLEIIIVANGCIDETKEYVDNISQIYKNFKLCWFDKPLGYTKAINEGIKISKGEYIVLLNNDTILLSQTKDEWLNILVKPFILDDTVGVTGPLTLECPITQRRFVVFFCAMTKRCLLDSVGLLNEIYTPGSGEDIEYSLILENSGYKVLQVPSNYINKSQSLNLNVGNFPIYHAGEKTVKDLNNWNEIFYNNQQKLHNRFNYHVCVIMPCYNSEKTIKNSINSVLQQTYKDYILYVIDDNSTDDTYNIVKDIALKNTRVVLLKNEFSKGPSGGRNTAIKHINESSIVFANYISYCDSDDLWLKEHLEESINNIFNNDVDVSYSNVKCIDLERNIEMKHYGFHIPSEFDYELMKKSNFIYISSVVHKIECLNIGYFNSEYDSLEDWDYWRRMVFKEYSFCRKDSCSVIYNVKSDGMAGKSNNHIKESILSSHTNSRN